MTSSLPFAISPGVCVYHCLDNSVCACVLVGNRTNAVCTFTFCDRRGGPSSEIDTKEVGERALALAERGGQNAVEPGNEMMAKLEIGTPGDAFEREADAVAAAVVANGPGGPRSAGPRLAVTGARHVVQRAPTDSAGPGGSAGTLPYREATDLLSCIRIMGEENRESCREEVLGERIERPVPMPETCVPNRSLTWADFTGPVNQPSMAFTAFRHDLASGNQVIQATFQGGRSFVRPAFSDPTNRRVNGCAGNVPGCQQFFDNEAANGRVGGTQGVQAIRGCAASAQPDPSVVARNRGECDRLGTECDRVMVLESPRLLRHEQLHMDIACVLARKGTIALQTSPNLNPQAVLTAVRGRAAALSNPSGTYDNETSSGCNPGAQARWESRVSAGLPNEQIP